MKDQNVSNNLASQFRCPQRRIRLEIFYRSSVHRNELKFLDIF